MDVNLTTAMARADLARANMIEASVMDLPFTAMERLARIYQEASDAEFFARLARLAEIHGGEGRAA